MIICGLRSSNKAGKPSTESESKVVRVIMNNPNDLNKQRYRTWLMANFEIRKDCQPVKENIRTWIPPIAAGTQHLDHRDEYSPPA